MKQLRHSVRWSQWLGRSWLVLLAAAALFADLLPLPEFPDLLRTHAAPFTPGHMLGTDPQGRDVLYGLVQGARTALLVSVPATVLATALGLVLGGGAGFWGNTHLRLRLASGLTGGLAVLLYSMFAATGSGPLAGWWPALLLTGSVLGARWLSRWPVFRRSIPVPVDTLVSAVIVALAALPRLLLVLAAAATTEPGATVLIVVLTLVSWPEPARLMRAETRRIRQLPYLEAGRALGLPMRRLLLKHVLPNSWRVLRTSLPMRLAVLISLETTLSFLGVGLPPELPGWGQLLASSRAAPSCWWLIVFPTIALLLTALALRQLLSTTESASA